VPSLHHRAHLKAVELILYCAHQGKCSTEAPKWQLFDYNLMLNVENYVVDRELTERNGCDMAALSGTETCLKISRSSFAWVRNRSLCS
jgi:hypothetical protein